MESKLLAAIRGGMSVVHAAAVAGMCRSSAYEVAARAGLVDEPRIDDGTRRKALELVQLGSGSLQAIAKTCGISKNSVIRIRDRAAALPSNGSARQTRAAYLCNGCGHRVRLRPCVICAAREASKCPRVAS